MPASAKDMAGEAIAKVSAPGTDEIVPTQKNGSVNKDDDYEIVSSIPSVPVTMERPAYKPKGGLKDAGRSIPSYNPTYYHSSNKPQVSHEPTSPHPRNILTAPQRMTTSLSILTNP